MTKNFVSNVIRYVTHFRLHNQITFRLLLIELVHHIVLNSIILYHNYVKNAKSKKMCSIHCNLQHEVHDNIGFPN